MKSKLFLTVLLLVFLGGCARQGPHDPAGIEYFGNKNGKYLDSYDDYYGFGRWEPSPAAKDRSPMTPHEW